MRARRAFAHGQRRVEKHHALVDPARQVAVFRGVNSDVVPKFDIDIREASGQRANAVACRERQPDRVTGCRVRVLAEDDDSDGIQRGEKRAKNVRVSRCVSNASAHLVAQPSFDFVE
jgi:hypothetical protein